MKSPKIATVALVSLFAPALVAQDGSFAWPGSQEIGWYRTTRWPENTAGARRPLYRYFTQMALPHEAVMSLASFSFEIGAWLPRGVAFDASIAPLPESAEFERTSSAIAYLMSHMARAEMTTLDYVAIKGLALWKLSHGADGKPYMKGKGDVDLVKVIDDHRLNGAANDLVLDAWAKTVVRTGDLATLYTYAPGGEGVAQLRLLASGGRAAERGVSALSGVRVDFAIVGTGSFAKNEVVLTKTVHTTEGGWANVNVFGADDKTLVRATSTGIWGEVISPRGASAFGRQLVDGPAVGPVVEVVISAPLTSRWIRADATAGPAAKE